MSRKIIYLLVALLLLGFWWGWRAWHETTPLADTQTPVWVDAGGQTAKAWNAADTTGWHQMVGKVWEVKGELVDTTDGVWVLQLSEGLQLRCTMEGQIPRPTLALRSPVTLRGYYMGLQSDPLLGTDLQLTRTIFIQR